MACLELSKWTIVVIFSLLIAPVIPVSTSEKESLSASDDFSNENGSQLENASLRDSNKVVEKCSSDTPEGRKGKQQCRILMGKQAKCHYQVNHIRFCEAENWDPVQSSDKCSTTVIPGEEKWCQKCDDACHNFGGYNPSYCTIKGESSGENICACYLLNRGKQNRTKPRMDLYYSTPLGLTVPYLTRWFYKESSQRKLFKEFYAADHINADLAGFSTNKRFIKGTSPDASEQEEFDFIVVGGGSAGSVVVNRLVSHRNNYKVLLLEAGGNQFPLSGVPSLLFELLNNPEIDWMDKIVPQKRACQAMRNQSMLYNRGKGIGGTSNLNWMVAMRGNPNDFNRWASEVEDDQWKFKNLLPFFKKMESYHAQFPSEKNHGKEGPLYIESNRFAPLLDEWLEAGKELGFDVNDPNGAGQDQGFFPWAVTMKEGTRFSTQRAYIYPVLEKPNLVIRPYSLSTKIKFDSSNNAIGVYYETTTSTGQQIQRYAGAKKEVILSGGVYGSSKLLMLSGIGPQEHLKSVGIQSRLDLPVGRNLQDHLVLYIGPFSINKKKTTDPNLERDFSERNLHEYFQQKTGQVASSGFGLGGGALIASTLGTEKWPDMYYSLFSLYMKNESADFFQKTFDFAPGVLQKYFEPTVGKDVFFIVLCLNLPKSVGTVELTSKNPRKKLRIDPNFLDHPDDVKVMKEGVKFALKVATKTKAMKNIGAKLTPTLFPGCESFGNNKIDNDEYWECFFRQATQTMWHYSSTAKMGSGPNDKNSVVDSNLRVLGTSRLRVVDNSIQPKVVTTNTNLPAIMIGEKGSDLILKTWDDGN